MKYEDNMVKSFRPNTAGNKERISKVWQLLECRAKLNDSRINNRLLHELVFKYSVLERKLKALNQELTLKQDRIEQDLLAAAKIQRSLLPKESNFLEGLNVALAAATFLLAVHCFRVFLNPHRGLGRLKQ